MRFFIKLNIQPKSKLWKYFWRAFLNMLSGLYFPVLLIKVKSRLQIEVFYMNNIRSKFLITIMISIVSFGSLAATHEHSHEHNNKAVALKLNNGSKWKMDEHTRKMSSQMEETFFAADHSNLVNLKMLGEQLEEQLGELIKGCTMSGEAHDQLHLFLADYVPTVQNLAKAKDYDKARSTAIKIKGNLETYKNHFK